MKFTIATAVEGSVEQVFARFQAEHGKELFTELSPPFPPVKLLRFDGSRTGDIVSLELNFLLFRQRWTSCITDDFSSEREAYFIDEGTELPFFLSSWKHTHRIVQVDSHRSQIRDEIEFSAGNILFDMFLFPMLWGQFMFRKPVYKRYFKRARQKSL